MRTVDAELVWNVGADAHRTLPHVDVGCLHVERREQIAAEQIVAFEIRGIDAPVVENLLRVAGAVAFPFLRRAVDRIWRERGISREYPARSRRPAALLRVGRGGVRAQRNPQWIGCG